MSKFSRKMQKESKQYSMVDPEAEHRKGMFVLLGVMVAMILLVIFLWWVRKNIHG